MAAYYDALYAACGSKPGFHIYAQTALVATAEGTIADYRTAQQNAATGRAWVTHIDGTSISPARAADGLHLTAAGHVTVESTLVRPTLGY